MNNHETSSNETAPLSAIDRALEVARKRKAARASVEGGTLTIDESKQVAKITKPPKAPKPQKATDEEAAAANAAKAVEKANAKAERVVARDAKRALADASKPPAHMKKVEKARSKLPQMTTATENTFGEITANLTAMEIATLALHLQMHNRATATLLATTQARLPMNATVRITGGDPQYIGLTGSVIHSQKLRAKVQVEGHSKPVYIYNGEASTLIAEVSATGTDG